MEPFLFFFLVATASVVEENDATLKLQKCFVDDETSPDRI